MIKKSQPAPAQNAKPKTKAQTPPRVAILYGFCEGPGLARGLIRTLAKAGFVVTSDVAQADIIIAHSGGCFVVPKQTNAKLIVLVGVPFWPGRSLGQRLVAKNWLEARTNERTAGQQLAKSFWNSMYFGNFAQNIPMIRGQSRGGIWKLPAAKTVVVRNEQDEICTPELTQLPFENQPTFRELPGQHDDCWLHPESLAHVVQSEYAARLLA